jgi:hypothetical protein
MSYEFYGMLKIPDEYDRDTYRLNWRTFSPTPCFDTMCLGCNQRALVDESGMIRTHNQMGTQNRPKWPQCMGRFVRYNPVRVTSNQHVWFSDVVSYLQGFRIKLCMHVSSLPFVHLSPSDLAVRLITCWKTLQLIDTLTRFWRCEQSLNGCLL